jgi:hypothetical protein
MSALRGLRVGQPERIRIDLTREKNFDEAEKYDNGKQPRWVILLVAQLPSLSRNVNLTKLIRKVLLSELSRCCAAINLT